MWLCGDSVRGPEDPLTDSVYCKLKDREQSASRNQIKIQRGGGRHTQTGNPTTDTETLSIHT